MIGAAVEWAAMFAIAVGVFILAGAGWALIAAGTLTLGSLTADVWLPSLARHGRHHESDKSSRRS